VKIIMATLPLSPFDIVPPPSGDFIEHLLDDLTSRTEEDFVDASAAVGVARKLARDPVTIELLSQLGDRLEALAGIQRALILPRGPMLDLGEGLHDLCGHMADARFAGRGIFMRIRADAIPMDARRAWRVLIIVTELLLNAHRRGFRDGPGLISIDAGAREGLLTCAFEDDGSARRHIEGEEKRLGRSVLQAIAHETGGSISYPDGSDGLRVEIRMPMSDRVPLSIFARVRAAIRGRRLAG
jgi:two-component sensor histidine kinase